LPLTFQDALELTRKLGLRYLWIDSLCIVQDDKEDWRHEGGKMANIYSKSNITFAATNSTSSEGGLFIRNPTVDICEVNTGNSVFNIRAQHTTEASTPFVNSMPLVKRAWFFQERVLSPHIVHFATNELFWEDSKTIASEWSGPNKRMIPGLSNHHLKPQQLIMAGSSTKWWHDAAEVYTGMHLTYESDIFPALQGIASMVHQHRRCAYHAGLWKDSLVQDMLWFCREPRMRQQSFRAPTWSWASVIGQVEYCYDPTEILATVLSVRTLPKGKSALGELREGSLKIRGPGFRISRMHALSSGSLSDGVNLYKWNADVRKEFECSEMVVLRMGTLSISTLLICFWSADGKSDLYKRVGFLSLEDHQLLTLPMPFEDMTITVV
jgi:hypothetical protein